MAANYPDYSPTQTPQNLTHINPPLLSNPRALLISNIYSTSSSLVMSQYAKLKNDPKNVPFYLRWFSVTACILLPPMLLLDLIRNLVTLSPLEAVNNVYCFFGAFAILTIEVSQGGNNTLSNLLGMKAVIHRYFGFLEFCVGLGSLQILIGSLTISQDIVGILSLLRLFPGITLMACGGINVVWGVYAAAKFKLLLQRLRDNGEEGGGGESIARRLALLDRKFEALDSNGDDKLTVEELREGIRELNLQIDELELNMIFQGMDTDRDGYITKQELETWWFSDKGVGFL